MPHTSFDPGPLGKNTHYCNEYDPTLLHAIARVDMRPETPTAVPFFGVDIINAYELSWLDPLGKPKIAMANLTIPCDSTYLIESKSLKLYLNSLQQTQFQDIVHVEKTLNKDISATVDAPINIKLTPAHAFHQSTLQEFDGSCLDELELAIDHYHVEPAYLQTHSTQAEETVYSRLLRSNCPITNRPDWASVQIYYCGPQIDHAGLLKYIISYRLDSGFHEACIERIYNDIQTHCQPQKLSVYGRYTRRGGIDINPFRASWQTTPANIRLAQQ
ncbi:MAG: NADPH-dependent 7-cyano-7-deazaguanine reductase QueF [Gammaproteobacteria bacterium]